MRISDWSSDVCSSDLCQGSVKPRKRCIVGRQAKAEQVGVICKGAGQDAVTGQLGEQLRGVGGLDQAEQRTVSPGIEAVAGKHGVELGRAAPPVAARGRDPLVIAISEIGRASGRERVCQYVLITVVSVYLKKKRTTSQHNDPKS